MPVKEVKLLWSILAVAVILVGLFLLRQEISYTGSFIGLTASPEISQEKIWDLTNPAEYAYDAGKINLSGGEAKLIPSVSTTSISTTSTVEAALSSAIEYEDDDGEIESEDRTGKVNSLGQGHVQLKDDQKVLGVTMAIKLTNNDVLSVYLLNGSVGKLYVCTSSVGCSSVEHGELSVSSGEEGWRNLSLSSVSSPKTTFYLDSPGSNPSDKIKIDMVKGYNITTTTTTTTITTYPSSATLETADLQPTDLKRWGSLVKTETLNGQQIDYAYSTNSGSSWSALPADNDFSAVAATKLRLKATLSSDGSTTPILKSMKLNYTTQQPCTESWAAQYDPCLSTNTQLKWYIDQNDCGTTASLPVDNNTFVSCDFCTPSWKQLNTSCSSTDIFLSWFNDSNNCFAQTGVEADLVNRPTNLTWSCDYCAPLWTPQNTTCRPGDSFTTRYFDVQDCYAKTGLNADLATKPENFSQDCDYCATHDCQGSFQTFLNSSHALNATAWFIDAREKTSAWLEITSPNSEGTVTIIEYNKSRVNSTPPALDLKKQVEINSSVANLTAVKIILYYTDEELQQAGVDENTLKIHYYNESSGQWQELPSTVNATGNYLYAVVNHLSLYGLFGDGIQPGSGSASSSSASGDSGGGGGGGSSGSSLTTSTEVPARQEQAKETKEIGQPVLERPAATLVSAEEVTVEQPCHYVVEVTLPDRISFVENKRYEGEIENKGDCTLSQLELALSPQFQPVFDLSTTSLEAVKPGDKHSFTLIRKQSRREKMFSVITTLATAEEVGTEEIAGLLLLNSKTEDQTVYTRELPLRVEIPVPLRITSPPVIKMGIAIVLFILVLAAVHWDKEERGRWRRKDKTPVKNQADAEKVFNLPPFSLMKR